MREAAFYDLDGTLVHGNVITHYLFYALNEAAPSEKARRVLDLALNAPRYVALNRADRRLFNEDFYRSFKGISEDRLRVLSTELTDRVLKARMLEGARELVASDRANGYLTIMITGALDAVAEPIAKVLGIERCFANRLAFDADRLSTGELLPPVLAGPGKATFVRKLAREEGIDLEQSRAYADDIADLPFLSSVGHPVCVNPDRKLKSTAEAHHWPVLTLDRPGKDGILDRALDGTLSFLRMLEATR